jgi:hypothetical protein
VSVISAESTPSMPRILASRSSVLTSATRARPQHSMRRPGPRVRVGRVTRLTYSVI